MAQATVIPGHWYCDHCDDVVFLTYENITRANVCCPVCGNLTANFVPGKLTRKMVRPEWFEGMRRLVDAATAKELFKAREIFRNGRN